MNSLNDIVSSEDSTSLNIHSLLSLLIRCSDFIYFQICFFQCWSICLFLFLSLVAFLSVINILFEYFEGYFVSSEDSTSLHIDSLLSLLTRCSDLCASPHSQKLTFITKTYVYNFDPLKPHFYIVKLGFTGVYIIFLISAQNIDCGYSLEPPRRGGSNEYPQSMFWAEMWKISEFFSFWRWNFL